MMRDNLTKYAALLNALVSSVEHEEAILDRLVMAVGKGEEETVMAAATELAALRKTAKPENCAA